VELTRIDLRIAYAAHALLLTRSQLDWALDRDGHCVT
jgi:hypothetical protein